MKKMMQRIRAAKTWQQRAEIALDKHPYTPFDEVFQLADEAKVEGELGFYANQKHTLALLGDWFANIIRAGDSKTLRKAAIALNDRKWHKPKPDYDLHVLFSLAGMFPSGWVKRWGRNPSTGKLVPGFSPPPPDTRERIAIRDIKNNLRRIDPNYSEDSWENRRKKLQRKAKEFGINLDDTPGHPKKQLRHFAPKRVR